MTDNPLVTDIADRMFYLRFLLLGAALSNLIKCICFEASQLFAVLDLLVLLNEIIIKS